MLAPFLVRTGNTDDLAFVVSTLAKGLLDSPVGKGSPKGYLVPECDRLVRAHLRAGASLLVAHDHDTEGVILGWALATPPALHWVYVRRIFRGEGIARALLDRLGELRTYSLRPDPKALEGRLPRALRYAPLLAVARAA